MNTIRRNRIVAIFLATLLLFTGMIVLTPETAEAASKITLKSGKAAPSTIYAGHSYNLKVAGVKVKFSSSNKKVATIGATTGKLKAVAPGTVKITAKNAKTGKAVASKTFTVLQRAKSVTASVEELYLFNIGETAVIKATLTPDNSTDVVRFASSDPKIVSVGATSGKVTAKGVGSATISIYAKATKSTANSNKSNKVAKVKVRVVDMGSVPLESMTIYFDASPYGVIGGSAAWKKVSKGATIGTMPTLDDIEMLVVGKYELLGWSKNPESTAPDVTSATSVTTDWTLYPVMKQVE